MQIRLCTNPNGFVTRAYKRFDCVNGHTYKTATRRIAGQDRAIEPITNTLPRRHLANTIGGGLCRCWNCLTFGVIGARTGAPVRGYIEPTLTEVTRVTSLWRCLTVRSH